MPVSRLSRQVYEVVVIATMMAFIIGLTALLSVHWENQRREAAELRECVSSIPGYLDAQEIAYQEEECRHR